MGSSEPLDLELNSSVLKYSLTRSSSTKGTSSLFQPFSLVPGAWDSRRLVLLVEAEMKKAFSSLALSLSYVAELLSASFCSGHNFFKPSFCPLHIREALLLSLTQLARFNPFWALSFLTSLLEVQTVFWYSSHYLILCLILSRSSLFIHRILLAFFPTSFSLGNCLHCCKYISVVQGIDDMPEEPLTRDF